MREEYPDLDVDMYHENTEFRQNTCDGPSCEEPLTVVVPSSGEPYIPREHITHARFGADVRGMLVEDDAHFCSPECFTEHVNGGYSLAGKDENDMIYCGKYK